MDAIREILFWKACETERQHSDLRGQENVPGFMILSRAMMQSEAIHQKGAKETCPTEALWRKSRS